MDTLNETAGISKMIIDLTVVYWDLSFQFSPITFFFFSIFQIIIAIVVK